MVIFYKHYKLVSVLDHAEGFWSVLRSSSYQLPEDRQSAGDSTKLNLCIKDMEYLLMFYLTYVTAGIITLK